MMMCTYFPVIGLFLSLINVSFTQSVSIWEHFEGDQNRNHKKSGFFYSLAELNI